MVAPKIEVQGGESLSDGIDFSEMARRLWVTNSLNVTSLLAMESWKDWSILELIYPEDEEEPHLISCYCRSTQHGELFIKKTPTGNWEQPRIAEFRAANGPSTMESGVTRVLLARSDIPFEVKG